MSDKTRVRFAPSPTGFFHIGSARTALFNWLYARHTGGTFILRIEDTDKERNTEESLKVLIDGMRWLGLDWDEGPEVGGDCGPYFQSKRDDIYREYLEILRKKGRAYDKDGAVFFKVSGEKQVLHDLVYGDVERLEEKDFPIFRSNGTPVFHFVNVVDDIAMNITNVIRGQDHLTNTNKHIEIFKAFDAPLPKFAHIPLILKSEGQGKMSKRDRGALIEEYQQKEFIPDAVVNYLSLLGWNPKNGEEIMPLQRIVELFDFSGVVRSNARFDGKKMAHFNTEHIRSLPDAEFARRARQSLLDAGFAGDLDSEFAHKVYKLSQPKVTSFETYPSLVFYLFKDEYDFDEAAREKVFKRGEPILRMTEAVDFLSKLGDFSEGALHEAFEKAAEARSLKITDYFPALRFSISGLSGGPDLLPMLEALGKKKTLERIDRFLKTFQK